MKQKDHTQNGHVPPVGTGRHQKAFDVWLGALVVSSIRRKFHPPSRHFQLG